jgi:uncharacterized protein (TIRG00374 family)
LKKKILSVIQYIFFLLIGILLLWLVFRKLDPTEVWDQIRNANYYWLLLAFFVGICSHIARAVRWNILIKSMGYKTKVSTTFYAVMTGYLANTAFPRLGEVTRCATLGKKTDIPFLSLLGTVISERIFDIVVLMLIILGVFIFQLEFLREFADKYFLSSMEGMLNTQNIIIGIVGLVLIITLPIVLFRVFHSRIREIALFKKLSNFLKGLVDGLRTIQRMQHKLAFIAWTLVIWTCYVLMTYFVFFSLSATSHLNFWDGVTIMAIGSLGIVAPVPGGIGAYQFIVKAVLVEIYLVASEPALSYSIISWSTQTLLIIIVGIFSYYMLLLNKPTIQNDNA